MPNPSSVESGLGAGPHPAAVDSPIPPAILARAAAWMARLWSDDVSDEDRASCRAWRSAHPDHERAWQCLGVIEQRFERLPAAIARQVLGEPASVARGRGPAAGRERGEPPHGREPMDRCQPERQSEHRSEHQIEHERGSGRPAGRGPRAARRRTLRALAIGGVAAGLGWFARETDVWRVVMAGHRTATGEIAELELPDGTRIVMSTATAIDVRFTDAERAIVLHAGEILLTSGHDSAPVARPLRVRSRHGVVQALGTRFSVRLADDVSRVAVFDGAVDVRPSARPDAAVWLGAGQGVEFDADRLHAPVAVPQSAIAWTRGVVVVESVPLGDLIAELARYRPGLLRCDPAVADLRVSGVYSLRDTDRALHNLTLALPVALAYRTRYWVTVQPRRHAPG